MPQAIIYLDEETDKKVHRMSTELRVSKADVIIKILKEYKEEDGRLRISS